MEMLRLMNVKLTISGKPTAARPVVFVGNHLSYIDIPLLLLAVPEISFVAKEELASWPLFGTGMKLAGTIFVKRNSPQSRGAARESLRAALELDRKAIAVFPSGTTSLLEDRPWKNGAFRLAQQTGVPVQAFRLTYEPLRPAAFIDNDSFLLHLLKACRSGPIHARLEFGQTETVVDPVGSCSRLHAWAAEAVNGAL